MFMEPKSSSATPTYHKLGTESCDSRSQEEWALTAAAGRYYVPEIPKTARVRIANESWQMVEALAGGSACRRLEPVMNYRQ
jgi:hypothetical protein